MASVQTFGEYSVAAVQSLKAKMEVLSDKAKSLVSRICSSSEPTQPDLANQKNTHLKKARTLTKDDLPEPKTLKELQDRLREDLGFNDKDVAEKKGLSPEEMDKVVDLLSQHRQALSLSFNDLAEVKHLQMRIPLVDGAEPVAMKPRPTPPHLQEVERLQQIAK